MNTSSRPLILIATLFAASVILIPPPSNAETKPRVRPLKIGLVLEGGGALGFAHVGVLKVLEEEHIPIHMIAGTSMGSIVGAAYASGRTIHEMEEVLSKTDWDALFNEGIPRELVNYRQKSGRDGEILGDAKIGVVAGEVVVPSALVEGQRIEPFFQKLFGKAPPSISFDQLPIPYRAVAADIETGEAVIIDSGSLASAARASMSAPGFFSPVEIGGQLLVDGGITNNFPVDVALKMGADVLIGVEFDFHPRKRDQLGGPFAISAQILDLLLERTSASGEKLLRPQDILIHPDVKEFSSTSFKSAGEIMKAGEEAARKLVPELRRLAIPAEAFAAYEAKRTGSNEYAPVIDYLRVESSPVQREKAIHEALSSIKLGVPMDRSSIEKEIAKVHQTGDYTKVSYDIEEKEGKHGLVVHATEKPWLKNYLRFGFALEDDFKGASNYSLATDVRLNDLNSYGAYADLQGELGKSPRFYGELYQPIDEGSPFFIAPDILLSRQDLLLRRGGDIVAEYQRTFSVLGLNGGVSFGRFGEFTTGLFRGVGEIDREIGEPSLDNLDYEVGESVSRFAIDQYDDPDFPTSGYRINLQETVSREGIGASDSFEQTRGVIGAPLNFGATTLLVSAEGGVSSDNLPAERSYSMGGFFDISGFEQGSLVADNFWAARSALYHRFSEGTFSLFKLGGYYGATLEYASLRTELPDVGDFPSIVSGSIFVGADTPLLPVYLGVGVSDESDRSVYLAVGRLSARRR